MHLCWVDQFRSVCLSIETVRMLTKLADPRNRALLVVLVGGGLCRYDAIPGTRRAESFSTDTTVVPPVEQAEGCVTLKAGLCLIVRDPPLSVVLCTRLGLAKIEQVEIHASCQTVIYSLLRQEVLSPRPR